MKAAESTGNVFKRMASKSFPRPNLAVRQRKGGVWAGVFFLAMSISILMLGILVLTIINKAFGYVAIANTVEPAWLERDGVAFEDLDEAGLMATLEENLTSGMLRVFVEDRNIESMSRDEIMAIVVDQVVHPYVLQSWTLLQSVFQGGAVRDAAAALGPDVHLQFRSWINGDFLVQGQSSEADRAGVRTALLGSILTILVAIAFAFPVGVGAAIYLEEYAKQGRINRIIQTNIYNLSGVPSILYGLLGLAVFVRFMEPLTSGTLFGVGDLSMANGRTIFSAGLTLGLLVLPVIIITSQEAIRAVPQSLRAASLAVGATRWQTVWNHVLPASMDRILTGAILAVSRALGETAPVVVIGASTFIAVDPSSLFSKFTTLPIQIYQWTARPQEEFRNAAAAAIIVLVVLLLALNATAILFRDRIRKKRSQHG